MQTMYSFLTLIALFLEIVLLISFGETKCLISDSNELIVETKSGKIKGSCSSINLFEDNETKEVNIYSWLSIPYAEPPIKNLRFKAPKPINSWSPSILDGTKTPNACMQFLSDKAGIQMSEDCLYLNIYAPYKAFKKIEKTPILIFIHGGSGTSGSSMLETYNPLVLVSLSNTIVVTLNYRLDVFGFLHLKDDENESIEGNQALLDQHVALKWINENADIFGGDLSRITLMGHSAGSVFSSYHLLFRPSWPLFRNVILLSGTPLNVGRNVLSSQGATSRAKYFLKDIGCPQKKLIECARNMNAKNLTVFSKIFFDKKIVGNTTFARYHLKSPFVPTIDNVFFKDTPIKEFRLENFKSCNIINGFTSNENSRLIPYNYGEISIDKNGQSQRIINFNSLASFIQNYYAFYPTWPYKLDEILVNSILNEYTKLTLLQYQQKSSRYLLKKNYFRTLSKILSDEAYICPSFKFIEYLSLKQSNVFLYAYNYKSSTNKWPEEYGVVHGNDLEMIFGHPFKNSGGFSSKNFSQQDKLMAKDMIKRLSNFIHDNNPNSNLDKDQVFWPKYELPIEMPDFNEITNQTTAKDSLYLAFRTSIGNKINRANNLDSCFLWNNLIPSHLETLGKFKY